MHCGVFEHSMEEVKGFNFADSRDPWIQLHCCRELTEWQVLCGALVLLPALLAPAGQDNTLVWRCFVAVQTDVFRCVCRGLCCVCHFAMGSWHQPCWGCWGPLTGGVAAQGGQSVPQAVSGSRGGKCPTKLSGKILLLH